MRLGVLTGGGDCAGLNAAVRAVVRTAYLRLGTEVVGYRRGWAGVIENDSVTLDNEAVRGLLPQGGTSLGTSRSHPGLLNGDPAKLVAQLEADGVDALVAIGGDGTLFTTQMLHEAGFPVVAVPKTIDNDVEGTDVSIGFDTALAVATEAVDRLHTTAASHDRLMILEVMGRHAGHLAAGAGIAGGAAAVLVPERPFDIADIASQITRRHGAGRHASIVVVAEGATPAPHTMPDFDPGIDQWGRVRPKGIGDVVRWKACRTHRLRDPHHGPRAHPARWITDSSGPADRQQAGSRGRRNACRWKQRRTGRSPRHRDSDDTFGRGGRQDTIADRGTAVPARPDDNCRALTQNGRRRVAPTMNGFVVRLPSL